MVRPFFTLLALVLFLAAPASAIEKVLVRQIYDRDGNYRRGIESRMGLGANGMEFQSSRPNEVANGCVGNLMKFDQDFSFARMREIGYITAEEYDFYMNLAGKLDPDRVTFFHEYRQFQKSELGQFTAEEIAKVKQLVDSRLTGIVDVEVNPDFAFDRQISDLFQQLLRGSQNPRMRLKDASLYVVRGQGWDRYLPRRLFGLPWMDEAGFKHAIEISRSEHPLVWELGRVAKTDEGNISDLLKLAVQEMANEADVYGVDPAKTLVFAHARDRAHRILYERTYGFKFHAENANAPGDFILSVSLADLMKKYPSIETFSRVKTIEAASGGFLKGEKAARAQAAMVGELFQALDVKEGADFQFKPVFLFNDLYDVGGFINEELVKLGMPRVESEATYQRMMNVLGTLFGSFKSSLNLDSNMVADELLRGAVMQEKEKAMRIYNIDPEIAKSNPNHVLETLLGVREYYRKRVDAFHARNTSIAMHEPVYSILTTDRGVRDQAAALGGAVVSRPFHPFKATIGKNEGRGIQMDGENGDYYVITFSDAKVRELISRNSGSQRKAQNLFQLGKWQQLYRLHSDGAFF